MDSSRDEGTPNNESDRNVEQMEVDPPVVCDSDASTQAATNSENGSLNSSSLLLSLSNKSSNIELLAADWINKRTSDPPSAYKELGVCILKACGLKNAYVNESLSSSSSFNSSSTIDTDAIALYPLSLISGHQFHTSFPVFIEKILSLQHSQILFDEDFMSNFLSLIKKCIKTHWDSFRVVGTLGGIKIITAIHQENDRLSNEARGIEDNPELVSEITNKKETLYLIWAECFIHVFTPSSKDVFAEVRSIAYKELLSWARNFPIIIIDKKWESSIIRGFSDSNGDNRLICLLVSREILRKKLRSSRQQEFLANILQDLLNFLKHNDECLAVALKIFVESSNFMKIKLTPQENEILYLHVFHPNREIGTLAAQYVFTQCLLKFAASYEDILEFLVTFNNEALERVTNLIQQQGSIEIKAEFVLIDSMFYLLKNSITWENWLNVIVGIATDNVETMMTFLLAYVQIGVTGFTPKSRTQSSASQKMKAAEMHIFHREFHDFFSLNWRKLYSLEKVKLKAMALYRLIALFKYLLPTLSLDEVESILIVIKNEYLTSGNEYVIYECCQVLQGFMTAYKENENIDTIVQLNLQSIFDTITSEFLELLKHPVLYGEPKMMLVRTVYLAMHFDISDSSVWDTAALTISSSRHKFCDKEIVDVIAILFQIVVKKRNEITNMDKTSSDSPQTVEMISRLKRFCAERVPYFQSVLVTYFHEQYETKLRVKAFTVMCRLIEDFGPNVPQWDLSIELEPERLKELFAFVSDVHVEPCKASGLCCEVVKEACNLISSYAVPLANFGFLIESFGRNIAHDDIIVSLFEKILLLPEKIKPLAIITFNALMMKFNSVFTQTKSIQRAVRSVVVLVKDLLKVGRFENKMLRAFSIELHILIIAAALSPDGCIHFLDTLIPLQPLLVGEDIAFVSATISSYNTYLHFPVVKKYLAVLNRSL